MTDTSTPQQIDIFPWDENFNTELPRVDEQHRTLVSLINRLASQFSYGADKAVIDEIFEELIDYTVYHFETEETIWHKFLADDTSEIQHREDHQRFVDSLHRLMEEKDNKPLHEVVEHALGFLVRWLASHILESDRHMAYTVRAIEAGLDHKAAKARAQEQMAGFTRQMIDIILSIYGILSHNTLLLMQELSRHREMANDLMVARKQAEAARDELSTQETRLQVALEAGQTGTWYWDFEKGVVFGDEHLANYFGLTPELTESGIPLSGYIEHIHVDDKDRVSQEIEQARRNSTPFAIEYRVLGTKGERWVLARGRVEHDEQGRPIGFPGAISDITQQKQAEIALRQERDIHRKYLDTIQTILLILDSQGHIQLINPAGCKVLGYKEDDLLGKNWFDTCLPQSAGKEEIVAIFRQLINGYHNQTEYFENQVLCRDGSQRLIAWHNGQLEDTSGYISGIISSGQDITEQRMAQTQLVASEQRLLEAERIAHLGHWELDINTKVAHWSDEILAIFGISKPQRAGPELLATIVNPSDWPGVEASLNAAMAEGKEHKVEYRIRRPDGDERWVFCQAEKQYGDDGCEKLVGIVQDISDRKRAEERLRLAASVIQNTSEGVIICDIDGNIMEVNPAFCEILGYPRDEVIGRNPRIWQSGRHSPEFYHEMWQALDEAGQWKGEIWNRNKSGALVPEWLNISKVLDANAEVSHYVAVFSDISQIKQSQEKLDYLAHHDALTDLPNRLLLNERLEHALLRANRHSTRLAVLFLDLDRFKQINDSMGHLMGDQLLQVVTKRLRETCRQDDTIARVGGDEFVMLMEDISRQEDAVTAAQKVLAAFDSPFILEDHEIRITTSLGVCIYPRDGDDAATLLRNADAAMYRAKEEGRNTFQFYSREMTSNAFERVLLENSLHQAIRNNELRLVYQPQLDIQSHRLIGFEALVRWQHPQLGMVSPAKFIPLAEETGQIHSIGNWVLRTACQQASRWLKRGLDFRHIAVNVAGPQIQRGKLLEEVKSVLAETGVSPKHLELEVTESFIMRQANPAINLLRQLRQLGVSLAIDDFGTGYSSLSYLKQLPIQKLKIDQSFVRDVPQDPDNMAITEAVIALSKSLRLKVIAEGVENEEQARFLVDAGCIEAQGYLFSKPVSADEAERLPFWADKT
ncbi:MAG: bacteriohemerythrin [Candidatus Thiodiazotropha sp.]